ncbi:MAG TPA: hypothetical protein VGI82_05490 [Chitinophagaceae bacterium]
MNLTDFLHHNIVFIIIVIAIACVLAGRIWSNFLHWGKIADPHMLIRNGHNYKLINIYNPKGWTEGWEVGSIICFESDNKRFFIGAKKEIYISGDQIRFTDENGPLIGSVYEAAYTHASSGMIRMNLVKKLSNSKIRSRIDWSKLK